MNKLAEILLLSKRSNWCTKLHCSTCGATEFRGRLREFNREELIESLKGLDQTTISENSEALPLCFHTASLFGTSKDLLESLDGTPAGEVLLNIFSHEKYRKEERQAKQQESTDRHLNKLELEKAKASFDIRGAIRRKDHKAIEALIAKGADLDQTDENGITLREKIELITLKK